MIDYEKLYQDYKNDNFYSLQLEVGDKCNQGCIYCYMNALEKEKNTLTDNQIISILEDSKKLGITAIEWLGGEPLLRSTIFSHMQYAKQLGLKNNIWTGGLPFRDDNIIKESIKYADSGLISVHVSSVDSIVYEKLHPGRDKKDLEIILSSIKKIIDLGYPAERMLNSVTFTGLQSSNDMIQTIDYFEEIFDIKTSLNVYHTYLRPEISNDKLENFIPSKKEIIKVYKRYSKQYNTKQLPMNCVNKQYCSATVAILCDGSVTPCATIREEDSLNIHEDGTFYDIVNKKRDYLIFKKLKDENNLPSDCKKCSLSDICW